MWEKTFSDLPKRGSLPILCLKSEKKRVLRLLTRVAQYEKLSIHNITTANADVLQSSISSGRVLPGPLGTYVQSLKSGVLTLKLEGVQT